MAPYHVSKRPLKKIKSSMRFYIVSEVNYSPRDITPWTILECIEWIMFYMTFEKNAVISQQCMDVRGSPFLIL